MNRTEIEDLLGWVETPEKRGTIDIIWACTSTIFVCVWVMLHLNVPADKDSYRTILTRKIKWFTMAILAPELLMLFAGGQWAAAKRSVEDMKALGFHDWEMINAFYAESGGFVLEPKDGPKFPVTAKQIHFLAEHRYIKTPSISSKEISDKSKADSFAKTIAGAQAGWFVIQVIARAVQHLSVTLLELSTICLMTCTAAALFFWFYKPLDARVPTPIPCEYTLVEILKNAGLNERIPYENTPLDFCDPLEYTSPQFPGNKLWGEQQRPLSRIPNDRDSLLHNYKVLLVLSVPTAAFGALQMIAWNFTFPTRAEQMLWRYTCVGGCAVLGTGCALEAAAIIASKFTLSGMKTFNSYKVQWPWCLSFHIAGSMYLIARLIVITEVVISLRALPASSFRTVQWTDWFPHV